MEIKMGAYVADGNETKVFVGFVPDRIELVNLTALTRITWDKTQHDAASVEKFGIWELGTSALIKDGSAYGQTASGCVLASAITAAYGISALKSMDEYAMIESPIPGKGKVPAVIHKWSAGSAMTASRTTSLVGGVLLPTGGKPAAQGMCFELLDDGTTSATEPTWSTAYPGQANQDNDIELIARPLEVKRVGGEGFVVGSTHQTAGDVIHFIAYRSDTNEYCGDSSDNGLVVLR